MNFEWVKKLEKGNPSIGFLEIYNSMIDGNNVLAVVSYLPQFQGNDHPDVVVTLYFEGTKSKITDGLFHWMYDDICDTVKSNESNKFPKNPKSFEYLFTQTFIVKKLPDIEYYTHGDYAYIEPEA